MLYDPAASAQFSIPRAGIPKLIAVAGLVLYIRRGRLSLESLPPPHEDAEQTEPVGVPT